MRKGITPMATNTPASGSKYRSPISSGPASSTRRFLGRDLVRNDDGPNPHRGLHRHGRSRRQRPSVSRQRPRRRGSGPTIHLAATGGLTAHGCARPRCRRRGGLGPDQDPLRRVLLCDGPGREHRSGSSRPDGGRVSRPRRSSLPPDRNLLLRGGRVTTARRAGRAGWRCREAQTNLPRHSADSDGLGRSGRKARPGWGGAAM